MNISAPAWLTRNSKAEADLTPIQRRMVGIMDEILTDPQLPAIIRQVGSGLRSEMIRRIGNTPDATIARTLYRIRDEIDTVLTDAGYIEAER